MNRRDVLKGVGGALACVLAPIRILRASQPSAVVILPATLEWSCDVADAEACCRLTGLRNASAWNGTDIGHARIVSFSGIRESDGRWTMQCHIEPFYPEPVLSWWSGYPGLEEMLNQMHPLADFDSLIPSHARKIA